MTGKAEQFETESKLTAYVLGELDAEQAAEVERLIAADDAFKAEVEAIRETAALLARDFKAEPSPGLTEEQREAIREGPQSGPPVIFTMRRIWAGIGFAAAACVVIVLSIALTGHFSRAREEFATLQGAKKEAERGLVPGPEDGVDDKGVPLMGAGETVEWGRAPAEVRDGKNEFHAALSEEGSQPGARRSGAGGRGGDLDSLRQPVERESKGLAQKRRPPEAPAAPPPSGAAGRRGGMPGRRSVVADEADRGVVVGRPSGEIPLLGKRLREGEEPDFRLGDRLAPAGQWNREAYDTLVDNPFFRPTDVPLSTFSIDVDTASYANVRRMLNAGRLPPPDAVRIEEMINYFSYDYDAPSGEEPFSVNIEVNACPWQGEHRLVRIGLKGRDIDRDMRPATNLVFLLDVSGSMNQPAKLPLVRESMEMLVNHLTPDDCIGIVVYAGSSGLVLPSTYGYEKEKILDALDRLRAGGSTNGGQGIQLAYKVAQDNHIEGGVNRVILCTDGDFNVGVTSKGDLDRLIEEKRDSGVFLSVLGFGAGNWQDARMESLSNKGNGNFAYIDSLTEAKKVLVEEMVGTLVTIAKDVKIQVEFNPRMVGAYRLIGYANRLLEAQDFNDDTKDAGEIGAGHTVTALYEIIPPGVEVPEADVDDLKYQKAADDVELTDSGELLTVKLRYKQPDGEVSTKMEYPVIDAGAGLVDASTDFQFAAAVASFGMLLRDSEYKGDATWATVLDLASAGLANDDHGYRAEFIGLAERARQLHPN